MAVYRDGLLHDTLPFWINHAIDREYGGFLFSLDRDGSVLDTDKPIWIHGRFVWLLSTLYSTVEQRPEWLDLARHGLDFLRKHAFDSDGRMFFTVTRDGRPLRKRRYLFSESFAVIALAAYAKATGDTQAAQQALDLYRLMIRYHTTPGLLPPKVIPETRRAKGLVMPMILTATAQVLRQVTEDPICDEWIERSIDEIERDFIKPEFEAVLEMVGPKGEFLDGFDGRLLNPGHAIECGWFFLHEAKLRNDDRLKRIGLQIVDYSWNKGWDEQYGGIIYYRDAKRPAGHRVLARHEVLVAAERGDHRHAAGLATDRRREVRPLAPDGPRLGLRAFPRPRAWRVVRLPAPRRQRLHADSRATCGRAHSICRGCNGIAGSCSRKWQVAHGNIITRRVSEGVGSCLRT